MIKRIYILCAAAGLLLAALPAAGQEESYQQQAKELSTLYRGRVQNAYPFRYNGTFYLDPQLQASPASRRPTVAYLHFPTPTMSRQTR